mgnify:CR=1 FL=1
MSSLLKKILFNTHINKLDNFSILKIYLFMSLGVVILSFLYCNMFISRFDLVDSNNDIVFKKMFFEYGLLIQNIYNDWNYSFLDNEGVLYHLKRLPFFPILITLIAKISKNIFFIFIFKSLIFFSILFISILITSKTLNLSLSFFFLFFLPFLIPYNLHVILSLAFADSIIAVLLPSIFILLFSDHKKKYYFISALLFLIYLTKNSVFFVTMLLPIIMIILEKDKLRSRYLPIIAVIFAILTWGFFGVFKTGKFPFGSSLLTSNAKVLNEVVLNEEFKKYYPKKSVDLIPKNSMPNYLRQEWEIYEYFSLKNKEYLNNNFKDYIFDIPIKIKFIFFNIHKDNVHPINGKFENPIIISHIINRIFFNISILIAFYLLFFKDKKFQLKHFIKKKEDIYFLCIIGLALMPNIIGWATSKHLVSLQIISMFYLIMKFNNKFSKTNI